MMCSTRPEQDVKILFLRTQAVREQQVGRVLPITSSTFTVESIALFSLSTVRPAQEFLIAAAPT